MTVKKTGETFKEGDTISINGSTGEVIRVAIETSVANGNHFISSESTAYTHPLLVGSSSSGGLISMGTCYLTSWVRLPAIA